MKALSFDMTPDRILNPRGELLSIQNTELPCFSLAVCPRDVRGWWQRLRLSMFVYGKVGVSEIGVGRLQFYRAFCHFVPLKPPYPKNDAFRLSSKGFHHEPLRVA